MEEGVDKERVRQYRQRWQAVRMVQKEEARRASLEVRWRQLNAAFSMGIGLQFKVNNLDEMRVYRRWAKLKENQAQHPTT
jgi:hypothetical protein